MCFESLLFGICFEFGFELCNSKSPFQEYRFHNLHFLQHCTVNQELYNLFCRFSYGTRFKFGEMKQMSFPKMINLPDKIHYRK